jgi:hypothetical protein
MGMAEGLGVATLRVEESRVEKLKVESLTSRLLDSLTPE